MANFESINSKILTAKTAVVSGAGKGIGRAITEHFAANGADVCAISRTASDLDILQNEIKKAYRVDFFGITADISTKNGALEAVSRILNKFVSIDILVCAAGYPFQNDIWDRQLVDLDEEDFLKVFNVDVLGSFRLIKGILPVMIKKKKGVVILFSSTPAISGYDKGAPYTVAKAASLGLVKDLASEYGRDNIRAYAIAPGNIKTSRTFDQLPKEDQMKLEQESPMRRWGSPDEVAEVAVAIASDKMSFVTGQTIVVDGGTVMF